MKKETHLILFILHPPSFPLQPHSRALRSNDDARGRVVELTRCLFFIDCYGATYESES